jgi:hypothetical protein
MSRAAEGLLPAGAPEGLLPGLELDRTINIEQAVARFGADRVAEVADNFCRGDEIGYLAWKSLRGVAGGPAAGRAMLDQAIESGIDTVQNPPAEFVAFFDEVDRVPDWVDWDQLRRGSFAYWRAGKFVAAALVYGGYGLGLRYGGTRPLLFSRRAIDPATSGRRLIETLRWVVEATTPGNMQRFANGFKLTLKVRMLHASVREFCANSPHWAWEEWGLPVNSSDGLYQTGLFCAKVIDLTEEFGIRFSAQERADMFALWRYLGHVMGTPEHLNWTDEADIRAKMEVSDAVERSPDEGCRQLMGAMLDYVCGGLDGYHLIPPIVDARLDPAQRRTIANGLCRGLIGDDRCEVFGIADSRWRYLLPAIRPVVGAAEAATRRLPHNDEARCNSTLKSFAGLLRLRTDESPVAEPDELRKSMEANAHLMSAFRRRKAG